MALTATPQSALPAWDDTIVPALRKRLESESRILAKRMSVASISSVDDSQRSSAPSHSHRSSREYPSTPRQIPEPRKSSAIPRPSLQSIQTPHDIRSDASSSYTRVTGASSSSSPLPPKRARTYSQSYSFDSPLPNSYPNGNPLPTPESSRPTSPRTSDVKPTRIPIAARTRTISTSSHAHSVTQRTESRNGALPQTYHPPTPDTSPDTWVAKESNLQPATSPMTSIRHKASDIMNEPAPFTASSAASSMRSRTQGPAYQDTRPSAESEERPFEHWYRGDVHRNGGVGELRVAKHVEMLQIANYGYNLRKATRPQTRDTVVQMDSIRRRKRADSVGNGTRESLCLDDERSKEVSMVLDENPPTDIELDPDTDSESFYDAYASTDPDYTIHSSFSASMPGLSFAATSPSRSQTPTNTNPLPDINDTPKRSQDTQAFSDSMRSNTPSATLRTSAESTIPTPPSSGPLAQIASRTTSPTSQLSDQSHTKRRAKSPAAPATPKKQKTKAKTPPSVLRKDDPRSSVATYPTPEGDMVDAVPTWTQPVQKAGNWDEVVLPVVARKKGLDDQYEQANGSPRPKTPGESPVKPAPGTFGFDYTKYRPPADEEIPLDEFGRIPEQPEMQQAEPPEEEETLPLPIPLPVEPEEPIRPAPRPDPRQQSPRSPDSPAPFSHYIIHPTPTVPTINVTRPSTDMLERQRTELAEEDLGGGCCKCTIM